MVRHSWEVAKNDLYAASATLLTSSSASSPPPAGITSTSPTGATLSTAETPHSPTKGATLSTAETPHSPTKGATLSTAETPHSPTEIKSTTTEATPEPRTTGKPSPTPSGAPSTTTTSTPPLPLRIFNVSFHITNENFSAALENSASREYIELKRKIGSMVSAQMVELSACRKQVRPLPKLQVLLFSEFISKLEWKRTVVQIRYNSIYNCSTCSLGYAGFTLIAFRPGSVAVDSELSFESKNMSAKDVEHRLNTADNASRANLTLDRVTATLLTSSSTSSPPPAGITSTSPTGATLSTAETPHSPTKGATLSTAEAPHSPTKGETLSTAEAPHSPTKIKSTISEATPEPRTTGKPSRTPSGAPSTTTTSTPPVPLRIFDVSFHITNKNFSAALENSASREYIELKSKIGSMYNSIYNCSTCSLGYAGFTLIAFRPGSVAVESQILFQNKDMSARDIEHRLNTADSASRGGLILDRVTVTSTSPGPTSAPKTVPGWGIALLVLVSILVFFLILGLLVLLIHWCRRNQRGNMELLSNHEAYHPMNEYPTYQTHGRYMAPGNKQNPYNEVSLKHTPTFSKPEAIEIPTTQPKNGTRPFSYTNTAMANDDL
ncbi:mucin-1 [Candoia aspera]|uniref:mucin-1 n=1 Tax=Candoia aspera TaxID=51853 RepID=UPI002FD864EC